MIPFFFVSWAQESSPEGKDSGQLGGVTQTVNSMEVKVDQQIDILDHQIQEIDLLIQALSTTAPPPSPLLSPLQWPPTVPLVCPEAPPPAPPSSASVSTRHQTPHPLPPEG